MRDGAAPRAADFCTRARRQPERRSMLVPMGFTDGRWYDACQRGDTARAQSLLAHCEGVPNWDYEPLQHACSFGRVDILARLLQHGARVSFGKNRRTLLHVALGSSDNSEEMIRLLIAHGADPTLRDYDRDDDTPLHTATISNDVDALRIMLDCCVVDVNGPHAQAGNTLLQTACEHLSVEAVRLLLNRDARDIPTNSEMTPFGGRTPLMLAAMKHKPAVKDVIQLLCERGHDIERIDNAGRTALYWACEIHSIVSVRTLLARGACINQAQFCGRPPLDMVQHNDGFMKKEIIALFDFFVFIYYRQRLILDVAGKRSEANHPTSARHRVVEDTHLSRYLMSFFARRKPVVKTATPTSRGPARCVV